jgi:hypothetical protein
MNGAIGVALIAVAGAAIISGMGFVSVRADRARRSRSAKSMASSDTLTIKKDDTSAITMAAVGTGNVSGNEGSNLAATSGITR